LKESLVQTGNEKWCKAKNNDTSNFINWSERMLDQSISLPKDGEW